MQGALVHYSGRVQGVGFRYSVKRIATGFEVVGLVRNLPDGRVELRAGGTAAELEEFLVAIRESHLRHHIAEESRAPLEPESHWRGFAITH